MPQPALGGIIYYYYCFYFVTHGWSPNVTFKILYLVLVDFGLKVCRHREITLWSSLSYEQLICCKETIPSSARREMLKSRMDKLTK